MQDYTKRTAVIKAIIRALRAVDGNRERAAKLLGIGTRTLYRNIKSSEIKEGRGYTVEQEPVYPGNRR